MLPNDALIRVNVDDIAHIQHGHVALDGQGTGVFHGVEKNGGYLAANANPTGTFVGDMRYIVPGKP